MAVRHRQPLGAKARRYYWNSASSRFQYLKPSSRLIPERNQSHVRVAEIWQYRLYSTGYNDIIIRNTRQNYLRVTSDNIKTKVWNFTLNNRKDLLNGPTRRIMHGTVLPKSSS